MKHTGDSIGVVTVGVVPLLPLPGAVTVTRGFFLLYAAFYRQGRVTQLQAVLMGGDACQSSWPPGD